MEIWSPTLGTWRTSPEHKAKPTWTQMTQVLFMSSNPNSVNNHMETLPGAFRKIKTKFFQLINQFNNSNHLLHNIIQGHKLVNQSVIQSLVTNLISTINLHINKIHTLNLHINHPHNSLINHSISHHLLNNIISSLIKINSHNHLQHNNIILIINNHSNHNNPHNHRINLLHSSLITHLHNHHNKSHNPINNSHNKINNSQIKLEINQIWHITMDFGVHN